MLWRKMESNIWKTSKPLNFISRMWESEFYVSCNFCIQTKTNPLPVYWHRELDYKGFEGKKLFNPHLSSTLHNALLLQYYCVCHCNAKDQQTNYSLLRQYSRPYHGMSYFIWKTYFAWFLLQFACALLAFHSISHVAGMRSKVRTYIAINNR